VSARSLSLAALAATLAFGASTPARAQDRPSEQDMFGGGAPAAAPDAGTPATPDGGTPAPAAAPTAPPAAAADVAGPPPGSSDTDARDRDLLGSGKASEHLSDYIAPDNPLSIGGQLYLRSQTSGKSGQAFDQWSFTAPSLLDVYLDARPNPRVRAFILGRMSFDPTAPPASASAAPPDMNLTGGSATGFTSFTTARGPTSVLDQMWIRFDVLNRVFVTAGKQHVRWGTGRFWQPTDYLHPVKRNPLDVFDSRPGTTMLKLHVPIEDLGWNFYGFGVFEDPNQASNTLQQIAGGARAELVLLGAEVGLDAFVKDHQRPRFGVDLSTGIWELDVYADVGLRYGDDFCFVVPADKSPIYTNGGGACPPMGTLSFTPSPGYTAAANMFDVLPGTGFKAQAVGGINWSHKYNDNDMFTIGAEYFYNQAGYSDTSLYPGLLVNANNTPFLNFFYTGRQYGAVFASFPQPYSWNLTTFTLSTLSNLSDQSFISRIDYSYTLLTHISLEAFAGVHYGHSGGEFRLGFDIAGYHNAPALVDLGLALRLKI